MKATPRRICLALMVETLFVSAPVHAQPPSGQTGRTADCAACVYFDSNTLQQFEQQLKGYVELRESLQSGLPFLQITIHPSEIEQAERLLADRLQQARRAAQQGEIFVPPLQRQIRQMLVREVDAQTLAAIMEDNPGEFQFNLNGTYPKDRPLSTVPPKILSLLPALEDGIEYRFVGRHLILRDAKANIVIDTLPHAIDCPDCIVDPAYDDDDDRADILRRVSDPRSWK